LTGWRRRFLGNWVGSDLRTRLGLGFEEGQDDRICGMRGGDGQDGRICGVSGGADRMTGFAGWVEGTDRMGGCPGWPFCRRSHPVGVARYPVILLILSSCPSLQPSCSSPPKDPDSGTCRRRLVVPVGCGIADPRTAWIPAAGL